ncbi:TPA: hypothetical protein F8S49_12570 [Legionella pneumophila]|nr:hypothetical protein [Legionella pneumophila]HAU1496827.1 hypothetical protein [Legionella pneumophila]HAU1528234.1 hypothetical protein [Legionella pneumophila]
MNIKLTLTQAIVFFYKLLHSFASWYCPSIQNHILLNSYLWLFKVKKFAIPCRSHALIASVLFMLVIGSNLQTR